MPGRPASEPGGTIQSRRARRYYIEAVCFTVTELSVYEGTEIGMRQYLDSLSRDGWQIVKAYEL